MVFALITNHQLAEMADMATMNAPSLSAISQIDGMGEKRRDQYGQQFLDVIIEAQRMASSTPGL
jgi:superfamily II DNA helicase RecQ